jgi:hypothetical protein
LRAGDERVDGWGRKEGRKEELARGIGGERDGQLKVARYKS